MSSEWCQNKKCQEKKNQNQIRGSKGAKYYQSNKALSYLGYWCSNGCRDTWFNDNANTCMQAVGFIDKQVIHLKDAWNVQYIYDYNLHEDNRYHLINLLLGVRQSIAKNQAQTPEQIQNNNYWDTIDDTKARELAVTLGLAS